MSDLILLLDVGTTTISAEIIHAKDYKPIASGIILNSQVEIGEDVVSRIDFAVKSSQNAALLQQKVGGSVNSLTKRLLRENSLKSKDISKIFCACNSAMHHIFLGLDTAPLITPPYRIKQKSEVTVSADMIGLDIRKNLEITFLPNIGGFVGSDALCAIIASKMHKLKDVSVVVDIGTNGEIAVGNTDRISVASTAAGPAFEARYIKNGMPAIKGAISEVEIKKSHIKLAVIGNVQPRGITGSGLIDACYQLYKTGFINSSGRMKEDEFILYKKGKNRIAVTQSDIRKLQLAKGAMLAGMKILLRRYRIDSHDIKKITLTGSFGANLNAESVMGIGLIPKVNRKKVRYIRSAVLKGLCVWAQDKSIQSDTFLLLNKIEHVPLFGKTFGKEFADSLQF